MELAFSRRLPYRGIQGRGHYSPLVTRRASVAPRTGSLSPEPPHVGSPAPSSPAVAVPTRTIIFHKCTAAPPDATTPQARNPKNMDFHLCVWRAFCSPAALADLTLCTRTGRMLGSRVNSRAFGDMP